MKACPYCGESIQDVAVKCRYCGEWLDPSKRPAWSESDPSPPQGPAPTLDPTPVPRAHPQEQGGYPPLAQQPVAYQPLAQPAAYQPAAYQPLAHQPLAHQPLAHPPYDPSPDDSYGSYGQQTAAVDAEAARTSPPPSAAATSPATIADIPWGRTVASPAAQPSWRPPGPPLFGGAIESLPPTRSHAPQAPSSERRTLPLGGLSPQPPTPASLQALLTSPAPLSDHGQPLSAGGPPDPRRPGPSASESIELEVEDLAPADHEPSYPLPAPQPLPTPMRAPPEASSAATKFEDAFFGGGDSFVDDPSSDSMADGDPFASSIAPVKRPLPWGPILAGSALLLLVLAIGMRGGSGVDDGAAGETGQGESATKGDGKTDDAEADDAKSDAEQAAEETAAKGSPEPVAAKDPAEPATPPPAPVADDPALDAKIAEARAAYDKHKLKAAEAALAEIAATSPNHRDVLLLGAQIQLERGDLAGSLTTATKCVEVAPTQADCWLTLGVLHQNNKSNEAAVKAYETYLELAPEGRYARDATTQLARLKK